MTKQTNSLMSDNDESSDAPAEAPVETPTNLFIQNVPAIDFYSEQLFPTLMNRVMTYKLGKLPTEVPMPPNPLDELHGAIENEKYEYAIEVMDALANFLAMKGVATVMGFEFPDGFFDSIVSLIKTRRTAELARSAWYLITMICLTGTIPQAYVEDSATFYTEALKLDAANVFFAVTCLTCFCSRGPEQTDQVMRLIGKDEIEQIGSIDDDDAIRMSLLELLCCYARKPDLPLEVGGFIAEYVMGILQGAVQRRAVKYITPCLWTFIRLSVLDPVKEFIFRHFFTAEETSETQRGRSEVVNLLTHIYALEADCNDANVLYPIFIINLLRPIPVQVRSSRQRRNEKEQNGYHLPIRNWRKIMTCLITALRCSRNENEQRLLCIIFRYALTYEFLHQDDFIFASTFLERSVRSNSQEDQAEKRTEDQTENRTEDDTRIPISENIMSAFLTKQPGETLFEDLTELMCDFCHWILDTRHDPSFREHDKNPTYERRKSAQTETKTKVLRRKTKLYGILPVLAGMLCHPNENLQEKVHGTILRAIHEAQKRPGQKLYAMQLQGLKSVLFEIGQQDNRWAQELHDQIVPVSDR